MMITRKILYVPLLAALPACGGGGDDEPAPDAVFGHCDYVNSFTEEDECREYRGASWTDAGARADCDEEAGALSDGACARAATLGTCVIPAGEGMSIHVIASGDDTSMCSTVGQACESFARGDFEPTADCEGKLDDPPPQPVEPEAELVCNEPLEGEPPGQSEGGQVCTWRSMSGCTEPGRNFADYVSCDPLYDVRGYYPAPPMPEATPDPRLGDPAYAAELTWVKEQIESCSCVCCHQGSVTPAGAAIWDTEFEGNFVSSFSPWGLAFMAGYVKSSIFGSRAPEENNGFSRDVSGTPTTDIDRMVNFFTEELSHRGYAPEDFSADSPGSF
ncbi:hypothetical protein [Sorangium sp. So ce388]|uniref:hypothetical protein n=1 Tax=Sorangium sp. So ce388 TaxID=3133309 RepID=UPI003F5BF605